MLTKYLLFILFNISSEKMCVFSVVTASLKFRAFFFLEGTILSVSAFLLENIIITVQVHFPPAQPDKT